MQTKRKARLQCLLGSALLLVFVLFTWSLTCVDVQPIGPLGSSVAYAGINQAVQRAVGVNMMLYHITDWAGVAAIGVALGFAGLGLAQWIRRKHILRVDSSILVLGVYDLLVFGAYVFFEYHVINRRPVLLDGVLEASYPSSSTMLALCVMPTAMLQFRRLMGRGPRRTAVLVLCGLFTLLMVVGRILSGVHWITDILGGLLFSSGVTLLYCGANSYIAALADQPVS